MGGKHMANIFPVSRTGSARGGSLKLSRRGWALALSGVIWSLIGGLALTLID